MKTKTILILMIFGMCVRVNAQDPVTGATQASILARMLTATYDLLKINKDAKETLEDLNRTRKFIKDSKEAYELTRDVIQISEKIVCMSDELYNAIDLLGEVEFTCHENFMLFKIEKDLSIEIRNLRYFLVLGNITLELTTNGYGNYIETMKSLKESLEKTFYQMEELKNNLLIRYFNNLTMQGFENQLKGMIEKDAGQQTLTERLIQNEKKYGGSNNLLTPLAKINISSRKTTEQEIKTKQKEIKEKTKNTTNKTKSLVKTIISVVLLIGLIFTIFNVLTGNPNATKYVIGFLISLIVTAIFYNFF